MWTLEGLGALDASLVREAMKDKSPRMRVQAIRASETLYKAGDKSFADDYRALTKDADHERRHPGDADREPLQAAGRRRRDQGGAGREQGEGRGARRRASARAAGHELRRRPARWPLTPDEEKRLQQGSDVFGAVCFACHGTDGLGKAHGGRASRHDDGAAARRLAARARGIATT